MDPMDNKLLTIHHLINYLLLWFTLGFHTLEIQSTMVVLKKFIHLFHSLSKKQDNWISNFIEQVVTIIYP